MQITSIIEAIDSWRKQTPEAFCYQDGTLSYTYRQLGDFSERLAVHFDEQLVQGAPIMVYGDLEFDMPAVFLAAIRSGHGYIPIEAGTPKERIQLILEVAQPALIVAVEAWPDIETSVPVLAAEQLQAIFSKAVSEAAVAQLTPLQPDETCYIIFTSGTTGVPKGVQISHENLLSFVNWELQDFPIESGMRFMCQAPFSFDLSVMDLYPALCSGGTLVPMKKAVIEDFKELFVRLPEMQLDVWVSTPSFMDICLMEQTFNEKTVPTLKVFLFCGEELTKQTAKTLLERFPNSQIFNTYGPTETTVAISGVQVTPEILTASDRIPIGYVKTDTRVVIMEKEQALPQGEVGEIVIAGPSVSKGYMNNPEKTAAAFFVFEGQPAYRTGDAGRLAEDGLLLYEGRMDFQVKLHGFRIELEDIDHHLTEVSYVRQATVVPKYKEHKVQQLVAFIVKDQDPFDKEFRLTKAIKEELATRVMPYMIPQRFVYVDQLPRTANGKIDRKGLIQEVNS